MKKDEVTFADFTKFDLRVGKIEEAEEVTGSVNLIRMNVNLGQDYGIQKIITGIAKWYKPKDLKGKKSVFLANLAPKQMMKEMSSGMILCAMIDEEARLIPVDNNIPEGSIVR